MPKYTFGELTGIKEGEVFENRKALREANIHLALMAGIDGNPREGCSSIVLNGGDIDDLDLGEEIIYTVHGGNDQGSKRQIRDQDWDAPGNKALLVSEFKGLPVRVTRGYKHKSKFSPSSGYRYAGIFYVRTHKEEIGENGFNICRYYLIKDGIFETPDSKDEIELPKRKNKPKRIKFTVIRIVRDTALSKSIKELYDFTCQVCSKRIAVRNVSYAEGAHIKPLGKPHNGGDDTNNILCLCPNHHVMLDKGGFTIANNFDLIGISGRLNVHEKHIIDSSNLTYHRNHIFIND